MENNVGYPWKSIAVINIRPDSVIISKADALNSHSYILVMSLLLRVNLCLAEKVNSH